MKCWTLAEVDMMMRDPLLPHAKSRDTLSFLLYGLLQVATSGVLLVGTQNLGNCYCEVCTCFLEEPFFQSKSVN